MWDRRVIGLLVGVIAIGAVVLTLGGTPFRAAFWPSVLATAIGVVLAVPFGLFIAQRQLAVTTAAEEARNRKRLEDLLDILEDDLQTTLDELLLRMDAHATSSIVPFLPSHLWTAVTSSGEAARLTGHTELLRALANAYYRVGTTAYLERLVYEMTPPQEPDSPAKPSPLRLTLGALADQDKHTKAAIDVALQRVRETRGHPRRSAEQVADLGSTRFPIRHL